MPSPYFLYEKIINCKDTKEQCKGYKEYLQSEHWLKLRSELINSESKCERCGKKGILQLHHLTYKRLGKENKKDLMVLCVDCHKEVHENAKLIVKKPKKKKQKNKKTFKNKNKKSWKPEVDRFGMLVIKEKSANKIIKEAKLQKFDKSCQNCKIDHEFTWCDLGYKYCPYKKCADYKAKENENGRISKCKD